MFMQIQSIILLATIIFIFWIGFLVMMKDSRSVVNKSFLVFLFGIALTLSGFLFMQWHLAFGLFDKAIHYGGLVTLFGLLLFSQVFPHGKALPRGRWLLYAPFPVIAIFIIPFNLLIRQAPFGMNGMTAPQNGPLLLPYVFFWGAYFFLCIYFLLSTYRHAERKEKMQMRYLFFGITFTFACLFVFDLLLPIFHISYFSFAGPISSTVLVGLTAYSISKHKLLDIRIIIQKGIIYIFLLGIIGILYVVLLQFLGYLIHKTTGLAVILSAGSVMLIGIFFIRPLDDYFRKITDPIFFKDRYDYAEVLHALSKILHTYISQTDIVKNSSELLKSIFKAEWVTFRLDDITAPSASAAALSAGIFFNGERIGVLELGPKKSGDDYTALDQQLLDTFAYQSAVALEKGRLFKKVEEYNTQLEKLVDERTLEIKKLQEDQKQAMIDISHNLQTPLAIVKGELDLLTDSPIYTEKMQVMKKSVVQVSQFIRQLLHLAKLDHSAFSVELAPFNISALVREQVEYFEVMAAEQNVEIRSSIPAGRICMRGNKKLLGELLTNLVSNSIKYRRHGAEKSFIKISLSENVNEIYLSVEDNGIGIPEEDIPDLFTRFYRGSRKSNAEGTGLGLAICLKIVQKHSGSISVESILGEKTVFTIIFPRCDKEPK